MMFNPTLIVYLSVSNIPKHYRKKLLLMKASSVQICSIFNYLHIRIQLNLFKNSILILCVMTLLDEKPGLPPEFVTRNNA